MKTLMAITLLFVGSMSTYAQLQANYHVNKEKICTGKQVQFINISTGAQKYQWYVSGIPINYTLYSTAKDTVGVFAAGTYYIKMIATDTSSGISDTMLKTISVRNPGTGFVSYLHYAACKGDTMSFRSHHEAISTKWTFSIPQTIVGGCDTCGLLKFITYDLGNELTNTVTYDGGCTETANYTYSAELMPCWPTGIPNEPAKRELHVYPNPVTDKLTVSFNLHNGYSNVSLYNAVGALIYNNASKQPIHIIDMSGLPQGVYLLKIRSGETIRSERIIKQ